MSQRLKLSMSVRRVLTRILKIFISSYLSCNNHNLTCMVQSPPLSNTWLVNNYLHQPHIICSSRQFHFRPSFDPKLPLTMTSNVSDTALQAAVAADPTWPALREPQSQSLWFSKTKSSMMHANIWDRNIVVASEWRDLIEDLNVHSKTKRKENHMIVSHFSANSKVEV